MTSLVGWARTMLGTTSASGQPKVKRLGPYYGERFNEIASEDGLHFAYVAIDYGKPGRQQVVVHDAQSGELYD
jgi:hypothetical protein